MVQLQKIENVHNRNTREEVGDKGTDEILDVVMIEKFPKLIQTTKL